MSVEFSSPLLSCPLWSRFRNSFHQRLNDHGQSWTTEDTSDQCNLVITLVPFENYCDERMLAKIFISDLIKSSIKNETTMGRYSIGCGNQLDLWLPTTHFGIIFQTYFLFCYLSFRQRVFVFVDIVCYLNNLAFLALFYLVSVLCGGGVTVTKEVW